MSREVQRVQDMHLLVSLRKHLRDRRVLRYEQPLWRRTRIPLGWNKTSGHPRQPMPMARKVRDRSVLFAYEWAGMHTGGQEYNHDPEQIAQEAVLPQSCEVFVLGSRAWLVESSCENSNRREFA